MLVSPTVVGIIAAIPDVRSQTPVSFSCERDGRVEHEPLEQLTLRNRAAALARL
jgi:hypothetical protein